MPELAGCHRPHFGKIKYGQARRRADGGGGSSPPPFGLEILKLFRIYFKRLKFILKLLSCEHKECLLSLDIQLFLSNLKVY